MGESRFVLRMDKADKILLQRKIGNHAPGQLFLSQEFARICRPYVPYRSGALRDSARVNRKSVSWNTPYARRQFYEHPSKSRWHIKAWMDRGKEVVAAVAKYCDAKAGK
jgi:hypothetical protein